MEGSSRFRFRAWWLHGCVRNPFSFQSRICRGSKPVLLKAPLLAAQSSVEHCRRSSVKRRYCGPDMVPSGGRNSFKHGPKLTRSSSKFRAQRPTFLNPKAELYSSGRPLTGLPLRQCRGLHLHLPARQGLLNPQPCLQ